MDASELNLLRASVRSALLEEDIDHALLELGWDEVVADDAAAATTLLFEEHGSGLATSHSLDGVVLAALDLAADELRVLHPLGGDLIALGHLDTAKQVLLPSSSGPLLVDAAAVGLDPLTGIDPDAGWLRATVDIVGAVEVGASWSLAQAAARRALASELIGVSRAALSAASSHVTSREQFGRPIGSFQSVRHRLAEAFVWLSAAETVVQAGHVDGTWWSATSAKAYAGQAHADISRHCMQVCGAMGLTWEHELPRMVRRGFLLDALHGSAGALTDDLGGQLRAGLQPPRVIQI